MGNSSCDRLKSNADAAVLHVQENSGWAKGNGGVFFQSKEKINAPEIPINPYCQVDNLCDLKTEVERICFSIPVYSFCQYHTVS